MKLGNALLWSAILIFVFIESLTAIYGAEVGIASSFNDSHVACAPYRINPYKVMGIAHRTLPCGTKVEITNIRNGRKVNAQVVDLGPCTAAFCRTKMPARIRKRLFDILPMVEKAIGSNGLVLVSVVVR